MASTVKFKFKSAREFDTISFPGNSIKLLDLKRAIVEHKKLHQGMEFDLNIVNDKTKEGTNTIMCFFFFKGSHPEQINGFRLEDPDLPGRADRFLMCDAAHAADWSPYNFHHDLGRVSWVGSVYHLSLIHI